MPQVPSQYPKPTCATAVAAPRQPVPPPAEWFAPVEPHPSPVSKDHLSSPSRLPLTRQTPASQVRPPGIAPSESYRSVPKDGLQRISSWTPGGSLDVRHVAAWTPGMREVLSHTPVCASARRRATSVPNDVQKDASVAQNVVPEGIDPRSFRQWAFGVAKALRSLESSVDNLRNRLDVVEGITIGPSHPKTKAFKYNARANGSEKTWTPTFDLSCTKLMVDRAVSDPAGLDHTTLRRQWRLEVGSSIPRESDTSPQRQRLEQKQKPIESDTPPQRQSLEKKEVPKIHGLQRGPMQTDVKSQIVQTPLSREARFRSTTLRTPRTGGPTTPRGQKTRSERHDIWCEVSRHEKDPELQIRSLPPPQRSVTPDKTPRGDSSDLADGDEEGLSPAVLFEASSEASDGDVIKSSPRLEDVDEEAWPEAYLQTPLLSLQDKEACWLIQEEPAEMLLVADEANTDSPELSSSMHAVQFSEARQERERTASVVTPEILDLNSEELVASSDRQLTPADDTQSTVQEVSIDLQGGSGREVSVREGSGREVSDEVAHVKDIQQMHTQEQATSWECSPGDAFSPLQPTVMPGLRPVEITEMRPLDLQSEEARERHGRDHAGTDDVQSPRNT